MNDITIHLACLFKELDRRNKYQEWQQGTYHPDEDPTFPSVLIPKKINDETARLAKEYSDTIGG